MSYHTLQRVVVRMLFDPQFVASVYAQPQEALAGLDLTAPEQAQLLTIDHRAWGYDLLRQRRTLRTLVEEFKISTTLILAATRSIATLESFFSSSFFHQAIATRASMGMAFAHFLSDLYQRGTVKFPQLPDILRMETTLARCRRQLIPRSEEIALPATINELMHVQLATAVDVGSYQANTIITIQQVEQYLFEVSLMPAMVLCDDAPRLQNLPRVDLQNKIYLLFAPGANGMALLNIDREEYLVLIEARRRLTLRQLLTAATTAGVKKSVAENIINQALTQQTLVVVN